MEEIRKVGIVGSGIIGASWALVFARAGLDVRIWCRTEESGAAAKASVAASIASLAGTGLEGDTDTLGRISVHYGLCEALFNVDYVQESISENLQLKTAMLKQVEAIVPANAIIGSSTSGLMPSQLASDCLHPENVLVVHPLTPPHLIPITEICGSPETSVETIDRVCGFLRQLGQHPVVLQKEIPGFALNRILGALLNECFALVRDGVIGPWDIDPLLTEGFGLRWAMIGPLAAMDLNAPGGVAEYLTRYGAIFDLVARSRGGTSALNEEVVAKLAGAASKLEGDRASRIRHRDRAIAELRRGRSDILQELGGALPNEG
ncbi:3-hydroxyacyl-CoA dehydrogenase [Neorhizobium sp. P12A]|uniref:3-hydroxyacyl-CoA dehydrogenase NAD-binding domain-containing protein n=1 Tax=Neorhizobium sp. P12A TaxID=2268027 RepID=UPI0011ECFF66|nr:3-hydroxyacyl-CoA dehydrogenase NAD-binding domain-containing protein [Neorhizobium sp. P12A]KAA0695633.1 3-hydroxyacyl-CoA dehydrogenase [Neorhizobium sp. P12A]